MSFNDWCPQQRRPWSSREGGRHGDKFKTGQFTDVEEERCGQVGVKVAFMHFIKNHGSNP